MARIRTIKPEFPQSESMGRVSREARLAFILLWTVADDSGRLRGNSRMLASLLYPYDDDAPALIDHWLGELEQQCCIQRYEHGGNKYIQICKWLDHQKIDKPSRSKIPAFANVREDSRVFAEASSGDLRIKGSKDQGRERGKSAAPAPPSLEEVLQFVSDERLSMDGTEWYDHYAARGWVLSRGGPMVDWRAACRSWAHKESKFNGQPETVDQVYKRRD